MSDETQGGTVEPEATFGETIDELEQILARIEGEEIDIDQLASELERATVLLERARAKVRKAEVEVAQIVQSLERNDEGDRE